ncbi:hypothetical protein BIU82_06710 [Arthrobacter sp. SW1]|uniref:LacI family DNA-binding transcriptional regulator n=1 Tax=Arthrobacter sp. SW1 TaxID=1920889 RepID=UPI000877BA52|nr:LacI family DNA-binding transcriptional regulator [Arthrobacter sp. SW1]OFI37574.1 hypothetical protein BIU82_06710 [Arthrobacter sp. SW1]
MPRRITLADVAAEAGVSRALASIVMRKAPGASDATRARVMAAAEQLGYRPDTRARLLRSSRTGLLGVVFALDGAFHADVVEALYPAAEAEGMQLALSARGPRRTESQAIDSLLDLGAEALLILAPDSAAKDLAGLPVPVTSLLAPATGLSSASTDEALGVRLAVEHLRSLGHRTLAHLDGGKAAGATARRREFKRLMSDAGLPPHVIAGGPAEGDGIKAAGQAARLHEEGVTAVVAFNDASAAGLIHGLSGHGIGVPAGLSVVGFDDSHLAAMAQLSLTSVRQDPDALAEAGLAAARAALEGRRTVSNVPPSLTVRSSTAPAPTP